MLARTVKLDYPIYTLNNRLLLAAGDMLSPGVLDDLIAREKNRSYKTIPFLEHGDVRHDLARSFQEPPYSLIFEERERTFTLGLMKKIHFIAPVLEFLDYFKENDFYTYRHTLMVFALSTVLARDLLGRSEEMILEAMAGTIHDFGKICVPLEILRKTDPLTRTNKNILEHHALAGFVLLGYYHQDRRSFAARVAKEHHERRDASGYPYGIFLRETMIEAIAVCDVYDALLAPRPYRPSAYDNRTALEEITAMARQGKLSRKVVQVLIAHVRKDRPHFRKCKISLEKRGKPPAHNLYGVIEDERPDSAERKGDA
jgi:HD-GYP domain-containing protein (c-di-GMP phosphodiesterase class II)